jgi:hypothetical protein
MTFNELVTHLTGAGLTVEMMKVDAGVYLVIKELKIQIGGLAGKSCNVAIKRTGENPWVPESAVHVKPHLVQMGTKSSQNSAIGADWQHLSRRFERPPTPKAFLAHILTVLGEL